METIIVKILRDKGISPSVQRVSILNYLRAHNTHPTVEEIYRDLSKEIPTLSKTTIYNTLILFSEAKIIQNFETDDNIMHYDGFTEQHAHFKCRNCGKIFDMPFPEMEKSNLDGFNIDDIKLFYYGTCKECETNNLNNHH